MKRFSERDDAIVAVEIVLEPIEVQVPPVAVPVEVRNVQVAVAITPDKCAKCRLCHCPSNTLGTVSDSGLSENFPIPLASCTK